MTAERFPVEATHIMMFARSIGDMNPAYHDPESAEAKAMGGVIAPPTFPMAAAQFDPGNPLIPRLGEPWFGSASGPGIVRDGGAGGLHAEQIFDYHRPVRAGDVLSGTSHAGEKWEKQSRSGSTLRFFESITEYHDQLGELVVTVTNVGVMTERPTNEDG
jgi:acyl dehydratase